MNYKKEIKLLCDKFSIKCSLYKYKGDENSYHFLYKTTNIINDKIYIGIKSTNKDPDKCSYLASGMYKNRKIQANPFGRSLIKKAVEKYGSCNFNRVDLLFFDNRRDAAKAERIIVDKEFIHRLDTYNLNLGGQIPPRKVGIENGNFNNKWTIEQKNKASLYFKENRNSKGSLNANSKITYLYDTWNKQWRLFDSLIDICNEFHWKYNTAETFLRKKKVTAKRYILTREKINNKEINQLIDGSRFKKQIYDNSKKY